MGIVQHRAVLATTWRKQSIDEATEWISQQPDDIRSLFVVVPAAIDDYVTILFAPDGSKVGWDESERCCAFRSAFILHLEAWAYEDGGSPWKWVEVEYGEMGQRVSRGNNEREE